MHLSRLFATAACVAWSCSTAAHAATLYDASLGSFPSDQGWSALVQGAVPSQTVGGGSYRLDTTQPGVVVYGNAMLTPLDTAAGFDLAFTLRIATENHSSANRAGYSVLLVGSDPTRALEIAFWGNEIWAYDYNAADPDRFVHGPGATLGTNAQRDYLLSVRDQQFVFSADGTALFSGGLRDYSAAGAPYTQSNFLFFGDNTSRATSISELSLVSLTPVPEPAAAALLLAGLALLASRRRQGAAV